ncbi:MAG: tryptophan 7-halogenase [Gammaproteobacteria bacterium]|nr:tryptophan 7-halogenase [Gammaproteobacteria bacterium]MBU2059892.1 tryptophan 7-halogenase [Gammaproteobacteria bacterium]MBU2175853.1 tryptophan 7-halogenase [Gammaproteobacteria bacterium]MBU2247676.1 tryptophan 7-halogenase [Gammaproteobacteria bacterium]MBU2345981.1 tryptophan 7-halogenase [Gammaproteobacteria bacterium]
MAIMHRIAIVGGGTAGWMTACLMAKAWPGAEISVIESPDIGIIGVGEGSTPSLKRFFRQLNIPDSEWMSACNATYKTNIEFIDWSPASGRHSYSHPFITQLDSFSERALYSNCFSRRMGIDVETRPEKFLFNAYLAAAARAPVTPANFPFRLEYGYHFDAFLLGQFLRKKATDAKVQHLQLTIAQVVQQPNGDLKELVSQDGQRISADLFVDCTGFGSLLMQKTLAVPFESFASNLFNDSALVIPTAALAELPVQTKATALSNGWAWQIPLQNRTGNGYVFSSAFINKDQAETELRRHLGLLNSDVQSRHLTMNVGQLKQHWYKNCLALGLAQGFIEPLEATALHLVQTAVEIFIDQYSLSAATPSQQSHYNQSISERFDKVRDYIVAHYKLNSRDDSDYWRANRANTDLSDSLLQILDCWYRKNDLDQEIKRQQLSSHFGTTSWHCLLSGYGVYPALAARPNGEPKYIDPFKEQQLEAFFSACLLNFMPQNELLNIYQGT